MSHEERRQAVERAKAVLETHQSSLMAKANVVGVGVGFVHRGGQRTDEIGLVVMVREKVAGSTLAEADRIPAEIEGVPVDVQAVGEIRVQ
jgi:hypothetical protein